MLTGTRTTTKGVDELESLKAVAALGLLTHDIQDGVDQLGALGVVALGPVVTGHQVVQVAVGWGGQLQGPEADVIQGLVARSGVLVSLKT